MLWQINRVRVNRCMYRCVSTYGGVRQRVVITVFERNVHWRALFCLDQDGVSWSACEKSNC